MIMTPHRRRLATVIIVGAMAVPLGTALASPIDLEVPPEAVVAGGPAVGDPPAVAVHADDASARLAGVRSDLDRAVSAGDLTEPQAQFFLDQVRRH